MAILKKWQDRGDKRPLNFAYDTIRGVIKRVNLATGIKFTCHDLRRLNAQASAWAITFRDGGFCI